VIFWALKNNVPQTKPKFVKPVLIAWHRSLHLFGVKLLFWFILFVILS